MAAPPQAGKAERAFVQDGIEQVRRDDYCGACRGPSACCSAHLLSPTASLAQDMRADGRRRDDFRAMTLELGVLPQARSTRTRCCAPALRACANNCLHAPDMPLRL
jgi:hypothetical protein